MSKRIFELGNVDGKPVTFDLDLAMKGRVLVQGSSGSGKSETIKKICVATRDEVQSIILDPEGEYAPLRANIPFLLIGPGGEVPCTLETAELVAHRLLETGVSAIIDLYELSGTVLVDGYRVLAKREWVRRFLVALDTAPKELRRETLLFIDEAHIFAPESGNSLDAVGVAVADIASRGRKRGLGIIVVTQRLALLSNMVIGLCENLLVGRTGLIDAPRTAKLFGKTGKEGRDFIRLLGRIGDGQFFAYGRAFGLLEPTLFQVERVPGPTLAKASGHGKKAAPPTPEELKKLLPRFADLPKEAASKLSTENELRAALKTANEEIAKLQKGIGVQPTTITTYKPIDEGKLRAMKERLDTLAKAVAEAQKHNLAETKRREQAVSLLDKVRAMLVSSEPLDFSVTLAEAASAVAAVPPQLLPPAASAVAAMSRPTPASPRRAVPMELAADETPISLPEQKVLDALGWFAELGIVEPTTTAVAMLAGYKPAGGSFGAPKAALNRRGWIATNGGTMRLTSEGRSFVRPSGISPTNAGIQAAVFERFGESERKVLRPLLAKWPESMKSSEVAEAAGYNPTGGAFGGPKANLVKVGVVDVVSPGVLRAANMLFPENVQ